MEKWFASGLLGIFAGLVIGSIITGIIFDVWKEPIKRQIDYRTAFVLNKNICPKAPLEIEGKWVFISCDLNAFWDSVKLLAEAKIYEEQLEK